jgi:hypothetical protein
MNEQNLAYLQKSLDYLGFGSKLNDVLAQAIRREIPEFSLGISQSYLYAGGKKPAAEADHIKFKLNFSRSKQTDMYFLNDYEVTLSKAGQATPMRQVFDMERDNRITASQAYKLLSGNALEKDVYVKADQGESAEKKKVWFKLNLDIVDAYGNHPLKRFYPEFKFNLSETIDKYPFKGLGEQDKDTMMKLIRNGNLASAELILNKKATSVLVTANPQFKGLDVFDKNLSLIRQDEIFPEIAKDKGNATTKDISTESTNDRFPWEQQSGEAEQSHGLER